jgi:ferredoxin
MIKIDAQRCPQNHRCPAIGACPSEAIIQQGNGLPRVDQDKCTLCQTCVSFCPMGAIKDL